MIGGSISTQVGMSLGCSTASLSCRKLRNNTAPIAPVGLDRRQGPRRHFVLRFESGHMSLEKFRLARMDALKVLDSFAKRAIPSRVKAPQHNESTTRLTSAFPTQTKEKSNEENSEASFDVCVRNGDRQHCFGRKHLELFGDGCRSRIPNLWHLRGICGQVLAMGYWDSGR